ncbi:uncharacterized protein LOC122723214 [Manihot esculenta]|uniref:uncharacterized protein LOC122723214 n=1 Tax=Manihot esculenta TaxID=3983 RepID=UPI001CC50028|nr:uncharacterized protein LOC122723214 [Manihot esculenta]
MPTLVALTQVSFVAGRHITDNTIIAQEVIHSMNKLKGKSGWMAIKVDLEKAYDKIRWDFLNDSLLDAGLPSSLVDTIMRCTTSVRMQVLWNGSITDEFRSSREIRQGDPLPSYLFVLGMERLGQSITHAVHDSRWKPISLVKNGEDNIAWKGAKEGAISVSEAYSHMMKASWDDKAAI